MKLFRSGFEANIARTVLYSAFIIALLQLYPYIHYYWYANDGQILVNSRPSAADKIRPASPSATPSSPTLLTFKKNTHTNPRPMLAIYPFVDLRANKGGHNAFIALEKTKTFLSKNNQLDIIYRSPEFISHDGFLYSPMPGRDTLPTADLVLSGMIFDHADKAYISIRVASARTSQLIAKIMLPFDSGELGTLLLNIQDIVSIASHRYAHQMNSSHPEKIRVAVAPFYPFPEYASEGGDIIPELIESSLSDEKEITMVQRINSAPLLIEAAATRSILAKPDFYNSMMPTDILISGYYGYDEARKHYVALFALLVAGEHILFFPASGNSWHEISQQASGFVKNQSAIIQTLYSENTIRRKLYSEIEKGAAENNSSTSHTIQETEIDFDTISAAINLLIRKDAAIDVTIEAHNIINKYSNIALYHENMLAAEGSIPIHNKSDDRFVNRTLAFVKKHNKNYNEYKKNEKITTESKWSYFMADVATKGDFLSLGMKVDCNPKNYWEGLTSNTQRIYFNAIDYYSAATQMIHDDIEYYHGIGSLLNSYGAQYSRFENVIYRYVINSAARSVREDASIRLSTLPILRTNNCAEISRNKRYLNYFNNTKRGIYTEKRNIAEIGDSSKTPGANLSSMLSIACDSLGRNEPFMKRALDIDIIIGDMSESDIISSLGSVKSSPYSECAKHYPYLVMAMRSGRPSVANEQIAIIKDLMEKNSYIAQEDLSGLLYHARDRWAEGAEIPHHYSYALKNEIDKLIFRLPSYPFIYASYLGYARNEAQAIALLEEHGLTELIIRKECCSESSTLMILQTISRDGDLVYKSKDGGAVIFKLSHKRYGTITWKTDKYSSEKRIWNIGQLLFDLEKQDNYLFSISFPGHINTCESGGSCTKDESGRSPYSPSESFRAETASEFVSIVSTDRIPPNISVDIETSKLAINSLKENGFMPHRTPVFFDRHGNMAAVGLPRAQASTPYHFVRHSRRNGSASRHASYLLSKLYYEEEISQYQQIQEIFYNNLSEVLTSYKDRTFQERHSAINGVETLFRPTGSIARNEIGVVYIFEKVEGSWRITDRLTAPDAVHAHWFGRSLAISEADLFVCAGERSTYSGPGGVYRYRKINGSWVLAQRVWSDTCQEMSISGKWLAIRSHEHVRLYVFDGYRYVASQVLEIKAEGSRFGVARTSAFYKHLLTAVSMSMDGDSLALSQVGSSPESSSTSYRDPIHIYRRVAGHWKVSDIIAAPTYREGVPARRFGTFMDLQGDYLAVGNPWIQNDSRQEESGLVSLFKRDQAGAWGEIKRLKPDPAQHQDSEFGKGVEFYGNSLIIQGQRGIYVYHIEAISSLIQSSELGSKSARLLSTQNTETTSTYLAPPLK